jgi:YD repeat-containing protein
MNRQGRKAMAARARAIAAEAARSSLDYDQSGNLVRITDERAQAVLRRAYERMLLAGGEPQLLRLTDEAAAAFPRGRKAAEAEGDAWLAVGLDQCGAATYVLRWLVLPDLHPFGQRAMAEFALFAALAAETGRAGFPVAGHA